MEVSGQLHDPDILSPGKEPSVPTAGWILMEEPGRGNPLNFGNLNLFVHLAASFFPDPGLLIYTEWSILIS
jgi:hypothetical protein